MLPSWDCVHVHIILECIRKGLSLPVYVFNVKNQKKSYKISKVSKTFDIGSTDLNFFLFESSWRVEDQGSNIFVIQWSYQSQKWNIRIVDNLHQSLWNRVVIWSGYCFCDCVRYSPLVSAVFWPTILFWNSTFVIPCVHKRGTLPARNCMFYWVMWRDIMRWTTKVESGMSID